MKIVKSRIAFIISPVLLLLIIIVSCEDYYDSVYESNYLDTYKHTQYVSNKEYLTKSLDINRTIDFAKSNVAFVLSKQFEDVSLNSQEKFNEALIIKDIYLDQDSNEKYVIIEFLIEAQYSSSIALALTENEETNIFDISERFHMCSDMTTKSCNGFTRGIDGLINGCQSCNHSLN